MVNFAIKGIRPILQRQLVDYERNKFQEILEETPGKHKQCAFYYNQMKMILEIFLF